MVGGGFGESEEGDHCGVLDFWGESGGTQDSLGLSGQSTS